MNAFESIYDRETIGCHLVQSVLNTYLIDLDDTNIRKLLNYNESLDLLSNDAYISERAFDYSKLFYWPYSIVLNILKFK
jgi:hypothetical protein